MLVAALARPWLLKLGAVALVLLGVALTVLRIHGLGKKAGEAAEKLKTQARDLAAQKEVIHVQDEMGRARADARADDTVDRLRDGRF